MTNNKEMRDALIENLIEHFDKADKAERDGVGEL